MNTLLVDNYDSFTYNVFHLLAEVSGEEPIVVHNDMVSWRVLSSWDFDAIVLSPGPGRPDRWHDFGVCSDILRFSEVPVLGICLGHQGIGHALNATVRSAPVPMHGRLSRIRHDGTGLFAGVPQDISVVRYHSLAVTGAIDPEARITAWTDDGVIMGIEHARRQLWGVQFHPESISSEHGASVVRNFYELASRRARTAPSAGRRRPHPRPRGPEPRPPAEPPAPTLGVHARTIEGEPAAAALFERLFGDARHAFWLDSAGAPTRLAQRSYLGTSAGRGASVLEYAVEDGEVTIHGEDGSTAVRGSIFDVLARRLAEAGTPPPDALPPGFPGGYVGYLGYECKADCGSPNSHRADVPDAVLMFANRLVTIDHVAGCTRAIVLADGDDREALDWLDRAEAAVRELLADPPAAEPGEAAAEPGRAEAERPPVVFRSGRGRAQYLADIAASQAALAAGDSYEVCLTDQFTTSATPEPWTLYRTLRERNPAPFAAYLKLGDLAVVSSSPERFLSVDRDRRVEARPIKGTAPRAPEPDRDAALATELTTDEKTFAEHLMIVDLLRNDLGRVCDVGSVSVPELMVVESYRTVHQLVSTIEGYLETGRTAVECVRACFPGGSMTGAPKLRTMGIIDELENVGRGVYSGALGWFGVDGATDLSIVIRTIVVRPGATTIGAGGAIVMQSDAEDEFDEILLKARAPMSAIARAVTGSDAPGTWTVEIEPARGLVEAR